MTQHETTRPTRTPGVSEDQRQRLFSARFTFIFTAGKLRVAFDPYEFPKTSVRDLLLDIERVLATDAAQPRTADAPVRKVHASTETAAATVTRDWETCVTSIAAKMAALTEDQRTAALGTLRQQGLTITLESDGTVITNEGPNRVILIPRFYNKIAWPSEQRRDDTEEENAKEISTQEQFSQLKQTIINTVLHWKGRVTKVRTFDHRIVDIAGVLEDEGIECEFRDEDSAAAAHEEIKKAGRDHHVYIATRRDGTIVDDDGTTHGDNTTTFRDGRTFKWMDDPEEQLDDQ